ncbi:MAG: hypothetical protein KAI71_00540 [Candidatus Pacebacteria bacterium]|nr:hypothetical protein [Candidatus Paceibacterota bacterium]
MPRFEKQGDGLWRLTVGTPVPVETIVDTTGSMGGNVDVALRRLPDAYALCSDILPEGCDLQIATGIFGDVVDRFVLCRPQFEMEAGKIVEQLTLMVPERAGGDFTEDPQYGLFGAAYLSNCYINRIGLKEYHFVVTDAPARDELDERELVRIFGDEIFEKVSENGHQINRQGLPTTAEVVQDLLKYAHAFVLQVDEELRTTEFWSEIYGVNRVVKLPDTEYLPQVQAVIIGLTEGTLNLQEVKKFLTDNGIYDKDAEKISRSLVNIPLRAQADLPNFDKRPRKGDLFRNKTDVWPIDQEDVVKLESSGINSESEDNDSKEGLDWL